MPIYVHAAVLMCNMRRFVCILMSWLS